MELELGLQTMLEEVAVQVKLVSQQLLVRAKLVLAVPAFTLVSQELL